MFLDNKLPKDQSKKNITLVDQPTKRPTKFPVFNSLLIRNKAFCIFHLGKDTEQIHLQQKYTWKSMETLSNPSHLLGIFLKGKWDLLSILPPYHLKGAFQAFIIGCLAHKLSCGPTDDLCILRWIYYFCRV